MSDEDGTAPGDGRGAEDLGVSDREAAKAAKAKQDAAALKATAEGQEAARKGRAEATGKLGKGATPQEIKEANDAKW